MTVIPINSLIMTVMSVGAEGNDGENYEKGF